MFLQILANGGLAGQGASCPRPSRQRDFLEGRHCFSAKVVEMGAPEVAAQNATGIHLGETGDCFRAEHVISSALLAPGL